VSEEGAYWSRLVAELQSSGWTLERIGEELGVSDRQVSNWKAGQRPTGLAAIRLQELHTRLAAQ
jgi:transcriptional regulator with XRE-family HTH domain